LVQTPSLEKERASNGRFRTALTVFVVSAGAGLGALLFNFFLRITELAPYPPEAAIEKFLSIIPETIQEPAVQTLGEFAGQLGLIVATLIAAALYGILGLIFKSFIYPKLSAKARLSTLELALIYSFIPWLLFGVLVLPLVGVSIFGTTSDFAGQYASWLFPISLLFVQFLNGGFLYAGLKYYGYVGQFWRGAPIALSQEIQQKRRATSGKYKGSQTARDMSRRSFIEKGIIVAGVGVLALTSLDKIFTALASQSSPSGPSQGLGPVNLQNAPAIFRDTRLASLVNEEITSNDSFYRVAIDIIDPTVDVSNWTLQVTGSVNNPKSYTLDSFKSAFQPVDQYNTFECVSNLINGNLVGNAKWTGAKISDVLQDAGGAQSGAQYVVFYSVDGYSVAIPISKAMMSDSILAYTMNDQPLPQKHGYPMRAVIPGLYGMMSAKFLNKIEVVDSSYQGYWQTRGWSNVGTVQTNSFITIPSDGASVSLSQNGGSVILAGMAYSGNRGISKVEVSVDGGSTWQAATLKPSVSNDSWTLWAYEWSPSQTGNFNVYARATDGGGSLQTSQNTDTFPNGATGYATIGVNVSS
jgi:DMSO/TMAO reductase YedYZ molybdopterin-dependent catalytic subunit